MKIYLASDHAGFELKHFLYSHLQKLGHQVEDCGAHKLNLLDDYPDFIIPAAEKVATGLSKMKLLGNFLFFAIFYS